ncbi:MAG: hypothetical protein CMM53_01295 [Rhodospirillaceae bacterium]|nr:hypothetical protein [Rhodospirillaceae bacterium]|tara:strand:- start:501 stop:860 length:360 start_codon:yes stop_codon:yes gene_type:complete
MIKKMIGTWRLVAFRFVDSDGNPGREEDAPTGGRMEYTLDGHMATATRQADGGYFSYFGEFELKGSQVFHHIELSAHSKLEGTTTVRDVSFEGDNLILTASPPVMGGPGSKASLIWEKI